MRYHKKKIPLQIWIIGISSALITSSAAMFFGVFGLFLDSKGASKADIGLIEGGIEGLGYILKIASGIVSDYLKKRKLIFAIGSFCSEISKLIAALFVSSTSVIVGRIIDRIGNGIQATPRDAFVGDYAPKSLRGTCFGLRQSLGTIGSILGVLVISYLLRHFNNNFRLIFIAASIPAAIAFVVILFFVHDANISYEEAENAAKSKRKALKFSPKDTLYLDKSFWMLMIVVAVFMLSRMSETLIILYGKNTFNLTNDIATNTMLVYNIFAAIAAYCSGRLIDRFNSVHVMMYGTFITILSNVIMAISTNYILFLCGVVFWGVQIGLMQNVFCAKIAAIVHPDFRGTGFGVFYLITAISLMLANTISGQLISKGIYLFIYGATISTFSSCIIILFKNKRLLST
ncbi:MAG: MFS transporter [Holosporales bacterium]|jgi:MFS family permease|nr:MFS transporter [Holosporales bacterium]